VGCDSKREKLFRGEARRTLRRRIATKTCKGNIGSSEQDRGRAKKKGGSRSQSKSEGKVKKREWKKKGTMST